ncbi:MAG: histidine phosphatase family protein [Rhodothermales bacterium]
MQETTFYFIRHGQTDHNLRGIVQGRGVDPVLNETGRRQAEAVARRLADVSLDVIYASTLRRAVETAEVIAHEHADVPVHFLPDLEEMAWGVYEGKVLADGVQQALDRVYEQWKDGAYAFRIEGGESILDVQQRGIRVMCRLQEQHPGGTVLVVTHGRFLRVLLSTLLDEYGLERMHDIEHTNTGVNVLTGSNGCFEARLLNCTTHLDASVLPEVNKGVPLR